VRDLRTGATTAVSEPPGGGRPNGDSCAAALSDDGRVVAYASDAENLAPFDEARDTDVLVHDRATGTTTEVLGDPPPDGPEIDAPEQRPAVSPDGSVVGLGFAANEALTAHVHLFAVTAGTTSRAALGVPARFETTDPALSAQGRWVAFASLWPGPGRGDRNQSQDVFVSGPLPLRPTPPPTPGGAR
jgi:Tol biopolymer transport system component